MKKIILSSLTGILFTLIMFLSCKKEKTGLCQNVSSRRIIGFVPNGLLLDYGFDFTNPKIYNNALNIFL